MNIREELIDLDAVVNQVSGGINAVAAMSRGLDRVDDPYADGFFALSIHLTDSEREVRKCLSDCLNAI